MPTITTNMSLSTPLAGETDYVTSVSDSNTLVDAHDHTTGKGVQIPTGGIANLAVTAGKIAADAVTTAKILDANVTKAKLVAVGQQIAATGGAFVTSSSSRVDVTGLSVSITTSGRPVIVGVVSGDTASFGFTLDAAASATVAIMRDATDIFDVGYNFPANFAMGLSILTIDAPTAGTYTYKVQTAVTLSAGNVTFAAGTKIFAFEL